MTDEIIGICKKYIDETNPSALQVFYEEIPDLYDTETLDWPRIFHRVYLHACLKGNEFLATWMKDMLYPTMDPIQRIALRQIFPYGNYLLHQAEKYKK